ncbi:TonB-dependent receptor [Paucibacter sp. AS339]|uniref:TonB-dependent receptor n=1 Tax=Paucibacter hankyongi TaxID=3133434 RepID=UPI0030AFB32D
MSQPSFQKKVLPHLITLMLGSLAMQAAHAQEADSKAGKKSEQLETVEIRGIRATLNKNLVEKRENSSIVDSISAEDVGKFPDKNVADSLQRVPGISVDRTWGEGRDIFVRGTDKNLNMTQLNGQSVASAYWWKNDSQSRGFNYDILPSEIVGSLDVYKSPSADLDEGSIGGLVNVKTRKPLDFKDRLTVQGSAEATYSKLPGKTDPQLAGLLNWKSEDKTFGVLLAVSQQKRTMRRDGLENFTEAAKYDIVDQKGASTPAYASWGGGSAIFRQDRERTTGNLALQFRPNQATDIVLNYMNSDMSMNNNNQNYLWQAGGVAKAGKIAVTDPKFVTTSDGTKALVGGTLDGGVSFEPIYREAYIKSKVLDLEGTYNADNWHLHGQVGTTSGSGGSKHDRNFWFEGKGQTQIDLAKDQYNVKYIGMNPLDPKALTLMGTRDWIRKMESTENYAQADLTIDINGSFISAVKAGLKLRDNTVQNHRTILTNGPGGTGWEVLTLADLSTGASPMLNQAAATSGSLTQYAWVDDGLAVSKGFAMFDKGMKGGEAKAEYYKIKEQITAAYVKADFAANQWRGDFGVRLVKTKQTSEANQGNDAAGWTLASTTRTYNDVLPNVNAVYELNKEWLIRGAVSRVMARNTFSNLTASTELSGTTAAATAGNPNLKPYHANQAEIGAEWYFAEASMLSATLFTKRLDTFIYNTTLPETIGGVVRSVTRPNNADNGATINGLEVQWQQPFAKTGFGTVVNYTYSDAKAGAVAGQPRLGVVGNSKHQFNASVFYEKHGLNARLSYNYRSAFFGGLDMGGQDQTSAYGQLDATLGYDLTDKITVYGSGVNLTNSVNRMNTTDGIPVGVYENGPRYTIGLRAKF